MVELLTGSGGLLWTSTAALGLLGAGFGVSRYLLNDKDLEFTAFIEQMTDGYYRTSLDGNIIYANLSFARLFGYESQEKFLACPNNSLAKWYVDPNRRSDFARALAENGSVSKFRSQIYHHKTGEILWISESAHIVKDSSGNPCHYEGTVREITDTIKRLELESTYRKLSENVPGIMFQARLSPDGETSMPICSGNVKNIIGDVPVDEFTENADNVFKLIHPDDVQQFISSGNESAETLAVWNLEYRLIRPDGHIVWVHHQATPELEEDGSYLWHGYLLDVTDRKNSQRRLHDLAYYDPVTKLANRRLLVNKLKLAMRDRRLKGGYGAVMFLDLDNFKTLNDLKGHGLGDELLEEVAKRLENCLTSSDTAARFGSDEFVVLINKIGETKEEAKAAAKRVSDAILKSVEQPAKLGCGPFHTTCSIGICLFDEEEMVPHDILRMADAAMQTSKENGRNCASFFCKNKLAELEQSAGLMHDLRAALTENQLQLYYQMQVNSDAEIECAEALIRWNHPRLGMVSPSRFIPEAEASGLILPITDWVLREAFCTLENWQTQEHLAKVKLSINVSARQFNEPGFVNLIKSLVEKHQVDPSRLILEMTEHVLSNDIEVVRRVMNDLKKLGVGFSLDDFGTGYSSLVHMRELPFDEVKIDGKFVRDLDHNQNDRAIIRSIIAMAKALELETVAEWVEMDTHREFLKKEGCTRLQGFLFSPALPLDEFEKSAQSMLDDALAKGCSQNNVEVKTPAVA